MGVTCECEKNVENNPELKYFFTRNNIKTIKEQNDYLRRERQIRIKKIKKFIKKNLYRLYTKEKYKSLKIKAQNLFFENEELNFKNNEKFFKEQLNKKLEEFFTFSQKEMIMKDLLPNNLSDIFPNYLISSKNLFPKLRDKISIHLNKNIYNNHKEYLNNLISYLNEKQLVMKKVSNPHINNLSLISPKDSANNEEKEGLDFSKLLQKNSIIVRNDSKIKKDFKTKSSCNELKEENKNNNFVKKKIKFKKMDSKVRFNLSWDEIGIERLVKEEINNFFNICFTSIKKNFTESQKNSLFLNILKSQENKKNPNINFPLELKKLIDLLYYLYLLKKYNYSLNTKCFYKINSILVKKKSIITDQIILGKRESNSKNENILKIKLLKKAICEKLENNSITPLESSLLDSMSSISSEEGEKDYSLISASNDIKLLKSITNNEEEKNNLKIEEEKIKDNKSELGLSILGNVSNREKGSLNDQIQQKLILKMSDNVRINKRVKTGKRNKNFVFNDFYNGQYDETTYLYAGLGTLVSHDLKTLYYGTFRYGNKEGMGILYKIKENNKIEYFMGEFYKNKINGYGIKIKINDMEYIYQEGIFDSDNIIQGKFVKIKKKDNGIITFCYEGEFKDNKFTVGKIVEKRYNFQEKEGKYIYFQRIEYEGEFKNGKKNGRGKEKFMNILDGNKNYEYEGNFSNGIKDGYGIINYETNNFVTRYEGFFEKDKPFQLYGKVNFKSGDIYEGFFENSLKDYWGLYSFYNTKSNKILEQYFGGFLDDSKHGTGKTIVFDKGEKMMIGTYKRGEKEGQFEKIVYINEIVEEKNKRRNAKFEKSILSPDKYNVKRDAKLPRKQIKNYPVYEENYVIDTNNNYFHNEYLDN